MGVENTNEPKQEQLQEAPKQEQVQEELIEDKQINKATVSFEKQPSLLENITSETSSSDVPKIDTEKSDNRKTIIIKNQ